MKRRLEIISGHHHHHHHHSNSSARSLVAMVSTTNSGSGSSSNGRRLIGYRNRGGGGSGNNKLDGLYMGILVYVKLLILWICIMGGDFLLEFKIEYLYPVYLLLHNSYEAYKFQGVAFTLLLISIVVSVDMICIGSLPPSLLYTLGSLAVWSQISFSLTPLGPLLILPILLYVDTKLLTKTTTTTTISGYTPLAAHCLGFPIVSIGFAVKSYIAGRLRERLKLDVRGRNEMLYSLLWEAAPPPPPPPPIEEPTPIESPPQQVIKSKPVRRKSLEELHNNNNVQPMATAGAAPKEQEKKKNRREDCCYRNELELRRLKSELQHVKTVEFELRGQLQIQSSLERNLRSDVVALQSELELVEGRLQLERQRGVEERGALEKRVQEEKRAKEVAVGRCKKATADCPGDCKRKITTLTTEKDHASAQLKLIEEKLSRTERELQNVKSTLLHEQKAKESSCSETVKVVQQLREANSHLEASLNAETKLKLDLFSALGEARREVGIRDSLLKLREEELEDLRFKYSSNGVVPTRSNEFNHQLGVGLGTSVAGGEGAGAAPKNGLQNGQQHFNSY